VSAVKKEKSIAGSPKKEPFWVTDERRENIFVSTEKVLLLESLDHWCRIYFLPIGQSKRGIRHGSLRKLMQLINNTNLIRINRFYAINKTMYSGYNKTSNTLLFKGGIAIRLKHRLNKKLIAVLES
jgi:hypothetical protein